VDCACKERERLSLVGSSETEAAIGSFLREQINLRNTDRWTVPAKREREAVIGGFSSETEAAIG
jgi:hypothetical protein